MKHHATTYPDGKCIQILTDNFYVNNLIITGNDLNEMQGLYQLSSQRMQGGGFTLRSWNSNYIELREKMKYDKKLVECVRRTKY